jgi:hypothetical protein
VNPLKAGLLSDFEPKLLEEYPYGLNSVNIRYGLVDVSINDSDISAVNSEKALEFRDWLANVKVQSVKELNPYSGYDTGVRIGISGVTNYEYDEIDMIRSYEFDICDLKISNDLTLIYKDEGLRIRNPEKFREVILSYCLEELQRYAEMTFYADLNHDGEDEMIIVDPGREWDAQGQADIAVYKQDGTLLFWDYLNYAHSGWGNYFLYEQDGKDYLMEFMPSMYQGVANYGWKQYEFDAKDQIVVKNEYDIGFSLNPEMHDFNVDAIYRFLEESDELLSKSMLLVSVDQFALQYSTVNEPKYLNIAYYLNWLEDGAKRDHLAQQLQEFYQNDIYAVNAKLELMDFICGWGNLNEGDYILANPQKFISETYHNIEFIGYEFRDKHTNDYLGSYAISADRSKRNIYLEYVKLPTENGTEWKWNLRGEEVSAFEDYLGDNFVR